VVAEGLGSEASIALVKRWIVNPGLLLLVPCAIVLDLWARPAPSNTRFYVLQAVELAAGAINLALMALNLRDGLRLRSLQVQHSAR
jgi:hypothetical protein